MASSAVFGKGTLLQVETAVTGVYQTIPECRNIGAPTPDRDQIDVTNHDSVGAFREFIGGLVDPGEVTAECNFVPTNTVHAQCLADSISSTSVPRNFRILLVGGTRAIDFAGYIQRFGPSFPHDAQYTADISIKVTGQITWNTSP